MADWRDVMESRTTASRALHDSDSYAASVEDGRTGDATLAVALATRALCLEIRALATLIDHAMTDPR